MRPLRAAYHHHHHAVFAHIDCYCVALIVFYDMQLALAGLLGRLVSVPSAKGCSVALGASADIILSTLSYFPNKLSPFYFVFG